MREDPQAALALAKGAAKGKLTQAQEATKGALAPAKSIKENPSAYLQALFTKLQKVFSAETLQSIPQRIRNFICKVLRGACFAAGTPVVLADGTTRLIEQIEVGDRVISRRDDLGPNSPVVAAWVTETFVRPDEPTLRVRLASDEEFTCTPEHPFWVVERGFVLASELREGDVLGTRLSDAVRVAGVCEGERAVVYNLQVEIGQTYFVGSTGGGLWVHNACDGLSNQEFNSLTRQHLDELSAQHVYGKPGPSLARAISFVNKLQGSVQQKMELMAHLLDRIAFLEAGTWSWEEAVTLDGGRVYKGAPTFMVITSEGDIYLGSSIKAGILIEVRPGVFKVDLSALKKQ